MKHSLYIMLQNKRVHTSIHASRHLERKNAHLCMHLVHTPFWHSRGGGGGNDCKAPLFEEKRSMEQIQHFFRVFIQESTPLPYFLLQYTQI